ncbi:MAG: GspH/FimT family pseudopilin [Burkholderiales bacterium]|nr:GspH/FimT family pseudopilin [Burkholderiales bacterium]
MDTPNRLRHHSLSTPPGQRGISLIEVLVTLTILGLLLLSVLPSIGSWMRNTEIRNAAESIQNGLLKTRAEAVKRNEIVTFSLASSNSAGQLDGSCRLSASSGSWIASMDNPEGKCDVDISDTLDPRIVARNSTGEGSPNVTVSVKEPSGTDPCGAEPTPPVPTGIAFNGFGRIVASPWAGGRLQCIVVDNTTGSDTRKLNIVVGSGGTVRMCDPAVTSTTDPRRC